MREGRDQQQPQVTTVGEPGNGEGRELQGTVDLVLTLHQVMGSGIEGVDRTGVWDGQGGTVECNGGSVMGVLGSGQEKPGKGMAGGETQQTGMMGGSLGKREAASRVKVWVSGLAVIQPCHNKPAGGVVWNNQSCSHHEKSL